MTPLHTVMYELLCYVRTQNCGFSRKHLVNRPPQNSRCAVSARMRVLLANKTLGETRSPLDVSNALKPACKLQGV